MVKIDISRAAALQLPELVLLDMDNTIYEYGPCHEMALTGVGAFLNGATGIDPAAFRQKYMQARKEIHDGLAGTASSHNRLLYFQRLLELCETPTSVGLALDLYEIYWDTFIEEIRLFDGVMDFLIHLKDRGLPLALVTDLTADVQFKKVKKLGIQDMISAIVTSEEAGMDKPSAGIFKRAIGKAVPGAENVWVIGDSVTKDVAGGNAIGAVTFLKIHDDSDVPEFRDIKPHYMFSSFTDLIELMAGLEGRRCRT